MPIEIHISKKIVKKINQMTDLMEAQDSKGTKLYAKLIKNSKAEQYNITQALDFNKEVLGDTQEFDFPEHFLYIVTEISNQSLTGIVTEPYECNLDEYMRKKTIKDKQALQIIDQVIKAVYSLWQAGYWTRNIRPNHFVKCGSKWKIQSFVFSEELASSNECNSEYLWDPKFQAPEFKSNISYEEEDFNLMIVWNIGSLLLDLLLGSHRLSNKGIMDKFKNEEFSFPALGINKTIYSQFEEKTHKLLAKLLHYNPKKRMTLEQVFSNKDLSLDVAKLCPQKDKVIIPVSKIPSGKSSIKGSSLNYESKFLLKNVNDNFNKKEEQRQNALKRSSFHSLGNEDDFFGNLQMVSNAIIKPNTEGNIDIPPNIDDIMKNINSSIKDAIHIYKSYYDQCELLALSANTIQQMDLSHSASKEIKMLCKYSAMFVALININKLADSFNQGIDIYGLDSNQYSIFQNSQQYNTFQRILNFKRTERENIVEDTRKSYHNLKNRTLEAQNSDIKAFMSADYKKVQFKDIKGAYRFIVKFAYDEISEQYNKKKSTQEGKRLATVAMHVTYCLTVDKLYMKQQIPDNFKYYFDWAKKEPTYYVPLHDFKKYLESAPKDMLIKNSRFILQKFYTI